VGPFVIQFLISGPGVFDFLRYQGERHIQIESLYATVMAIGHLLGWPMAVVFTHEAHDLAGALAPGLKLASQLVLAAVLGTLVFRALRRPAFARVGAYRFTCLALIACTIASNVLSPQYFIWAIPLALLLMVEDPEPGHRRYGWLMLALLVVAGLTTWISPYHYFVTAAVPNALVPQTPGVTLPSDLSAFAVVGLRNVIFLGIVVVLGMRVLRRQA
jgi:hypothetical protein